MARVQIEIRDADIEGVLEVGDSDKFPLALTKKLSDINNLTARSGIFSTEFKLPATKDNNELLEYIYDSNKRDYKDSFARKNVNILVDGLLISRGTLQIKKYVRGGTADYVSTYTSNNLEWVDGFDEMYLADIPFTNNVVTYDSSTIKGSWTNTVGAGDEWVFALINRGTQNIQFQSVMGPDRFFPDVFLKPILTKAFANTGYSLESDFFDTAQFKKLIIPYFGNRFLQSGATVDSSLARASRTTPDVKILAGPSVQFKIPYDDDSTAPNTDPGGNFDTTSFLGRYTCPVGGRYRVTVRLDFSATNTSTFDGGIQINVFANTFGLGTDVTVRTLHTENIAAGTTEVAVQTVSTGTNFLSDIDLLAADTFEIMARTFQPDGDPINITITHGIAGFVKVELLEAVTPGATFSMSDVLDNSDFSMLDLANDLTRMFNLYWVTDNATQTVKVEPRDDFYKPLIDAIDMTSKVDLSKGYELIDNAPLFKKGLDFQYSIDGADGFVTERNKVKDDIYAAFIHDFSQELEPGRDTISTSKVAATYFLKDTFSGEISSSAPITSRLWKEPLDKDGEPPIISTEFAPRILNYQYSAQINESGGARSFGFFLGTGSTSVETIIPYALLYPYEENGILHADVGLNLSYGYDTNKDNLIELHWAKTITAIEDGNRLVISMVISPNDFRNIDFKTPVYFTGDPDIEGYWVFEQIEQFTPAKEQTTKVTLLKHRDWEPAQTVTLRKDNTPVDDGITRGTTEETCVFIIDANNNAIDVKSLTVNNTFEDVCLDL